MRTSTISSHHPHPSDHAWNVSPTMAVRIQKELRDKIILSPIAQPIRYIAGCDVSLNGFAGRFANRSRGPSSETAPLEIFAGIIVFSYPDLVPVGHAVFKGTTNFPYMPGLLSFREIPALMECWDILKKQAASKSTPSTEKIPLPDVIMVDGQGIAHPRRLGIATHFGILADIPTIGCAKSLLYGHYAEPALEAGSTSPIFAGWRAKNENQSDNQSDSKDKGQSDSHTETIGIAVRSKKNVKPLIISPGYKTTLEDAVAITLSCIQKHRLPETTRHAHELVNAFRRGEIIQ